jgi:hypothetical protein
MQESNKYKPGVPKRTLLFVAAAVWTIAGSILLIRGFIVIPAYHHIILESMIGLCCGVIFYLLMFLKVSKKHITRILNLTADKPCMFAFFDVRSYVLMFFMISAGITVRKFKLIDEEYIYTFFITMGIPLLLSAVRFLIAGIKFKAQP